MNVSCLLLASVVKGPKGDANPKKDDLKCEWVGDKIGSEFLENFFLQKEPKSADSLKLFPCLKNS
jgi:hypothetical protein